MNLTCEIIPVKSVDTLADLEPGVAAETDMGIRWYDDNGFVFGIKNGFPIVMNSNSEGIISPRIAQYRVYKVLGKINMKFEEE